MEDWNDPLLQRLAEIDHHIAAAYKIHPREGGIAEHILCGEDTEIPNHFADLISTISFVEETTQADGIYICFDTFFEISSASTLNCTFAEISAKNLNRNFGPFF